ncbi:Coatomer subunit beta [Oopsacas minuta]|uniref:Coatomer subunit beta' n=1 Tax=Oopsacas minuta TaxID=111878 RepID=A0AAV7K1T6_9METZ|nr:Coatomer subunit beta [Oopsacas minuta]
MPLKLDIKQQFLARSDRVKCVDLHPKEPWMLVALYNGNVHIWNHETQQVQKSFEVSDVPVRACCFVVRKSWIVTGSDDMMLRVYNYNTMERVQSWEGHSDYIRCILSHPTLPYIITSSDDLSIKLWDWDKSMNQVQSLEGHSHYVMQIALNPKDNNTFASASLDKTVKVWQLGSSSANFSLEGHDKGVNSVDYFQGGDKPYLVSGADDRTVRVWDYQNKSCVQVLEGHLENVTLVSFHPELPLIVSGGEDGSLRFWHSSTYRLETNVNYGLDRIWCGGMLKGSNSIAVGYDEGSMILRVGREEPAMSMDITGNGKLMWAKHSEVMQANMKAGTLELKDGERIQLAAKDLGSCEIYPQTLQHNPNGRFVVVCGDGEYIIYTAMALRNKQYGSAQEFVWAADASEYAIRDMGKVKIFKNFEERNIFRPQQQCEGIFGGTLLGVKSKGSLSFHDWESLELIRRIEISVKNVFWNESGTLVAITDADSFYVLQYNADVANTALQSQTNIDEDGVIDSLDILGETQDHIRAGRWVGDCFIYTTNHNRLNYYVGGEIVTISHLDRVMYILGYIPKTNRLYLGDKECSIVSYSLPLSVLEYQTAIMRKDHRAAAQILPSIREDQRTRVAHFLDKQGLKEQALVVSTDPDHKFDLSLQLKETRVAFELAEQADNQDKWKQLSELALSKCEFNLARNCMLRAGDYPSLLLLATSAGDRELLEQVADLAMNAGQTNIAFTCFITLGEIQKCVNLLCDSGHYPEASFMAHTYLPSETCNVVDQWVQSVGTINTKAAESIADPVKYENLFPDYQQALKAQTVFSSEHSATPADNYSNLPLNINRNLLNELEQLNPAKSADADVPIKDADIEFDDLDLLDGDVGNDLTADDLNLGDEDLLKDD